MKKLKIYLKEYTKESILAPLFKLLEVFFDLLVPVVIAKMIDTGIAQNNNSAIWKCFWILILMALVGLACSITAQFFAAKASIGFATNVRQAVFDHIQSLSFTELDTLGTDTMITRLTDDINQVQNGLNLGLRLLLRSPFIVFGAMVMAFTINTKAAFIFVVTIPILFVVVFSIMLISIPLFKKVQNALDKVTRLTRENLTGIRVIRAFCREEKSVEEFSYSNITLTKLNEFVGRISALLNPVTYILINLASVFLIKECAAQVNIGTLGQGETVALYNYMLQIIVELIKLASLVITINKALACADRVSSVLDIESSMQYGSRDIEENTNEEVLSFNDVSFMYKNAGAESLSHISFNVLKGQTIGIIGGTGSGKSSLVSLISRSYDATNGNITLEGHPISEYSHSSLTNKIGVVPQKAVLFKGTIRENMKWGNENATDEEIWDALTHAQAKEVVKKKEGQLDFMLEQNGRNLSGGQKQRLTIARALVKKPEILILDDSASALDFATDAALRKAIRSLTNITTFIVSQRISAIDKADKILVLDNGNLVGIGTHDSLMKDCPVYQEIYYSQFPEKRKEHREEVFA